jgi:hypothetical protein
MLFFYVQRLGILPELFAFLLLDLHMMLIILFLILLIWNKMTMFYYTGSLRPSFFNEVGGSRQVIGRRRNCRAGVWQSLFCSGLCVWTKICHWFSHKKVWPKCDNISFVVVFVFVLFNSDLSCNRIGFVYEMNVLQEFLFY